MKLKAILTFILSMVVVNAWAVDWDNPSIDDCESNADLIGYMITIKSVCNLETESDNNSFVETMNEVSKKCIAQYGEKPMANAMRMGIFSVKGEVEEVGRNATCYRALDEYSGLFN
ncbi:hypothetical protein [Acinetobacter sp. CFCC 10889]|uniref:hypothetical protein n=1 Tax=Acinetobacter sp. CFCC 10889 TaxID=1775557 RepID=UPI0013A70629|nr:hypothetical protein [Acinetobacter sp. CFCC 10889]